MATTKQLSKHTPGPWTVDYVQGIPEKVSFWRIASKENICIAEIDQSLDSTSKEERTANAQLIATAPELLEALQQMQAAVEECLAEWIGKKRAANWQIINDATFNAARLIKRAGIDTA